MRTRARRSNLGDVRVAAVSSSVTLGVGAGLPVARGRTVPGRMSRAIPTAHGSGSWVVRCESATESWWLLGKPAATRGDQRSRQMSWRAMWWWSYPELRLKASSWSEDGLWGGCNEARLCGDCNKARVVRSAATGARGWRGACARSARGRVFTALLPSCPRRRRCPGRRQPHWRQCASAVDVSRESCRSTFGDVPCDRRRKLAGRPIRAGHSPAQC